ncbi:MAG: KpsF/GutQ family sugar-phosphate isomerase [Betaproteobacteria bacterium]|nr:KpsF/GutQ family sugar-phosphate isomerase [Betaproteobacteria bacterium]
MNSASNHLAAARAVLATEAEAITEAAAALDDSFNRAVETILAISGKVVVTGIGKSGLIAGKIAATFASTGTPALFVHPADALHGDLGVITGDDCIVGISHSGTAEEIATVLAYGRALGTPLLMITGAAQSPLAAAADTVIKVAVSREACPLNLAPTSSAIATCAIGDALAMALLVARGFTPEDFARTHPHGALGRRLLLTVADVMCTGSQLPIIAADAPLTAAIVEMSAKRLGMTMVRDSGGDLAGIFTDGDLRRCLERGVDFNGTDIAAMMNRTPKTIGAARLAAEAADLMRRESVNQLPVLDGKSIVGAVTIQMLLARQVA